MTKKILLAVTGLTPQVVTETLYALAVTTQPAFVPDEIHIVTTREGASRIRLTLLQGDRQLERLIADYALDRSKLCLTPEKIHLIPDQHQQALEDIRTLSDNQAAADVITDLVRQLTTDPDSMIHASIAGGRKTMSFYLGYALSLFGRPQDRLSHVLVSEPFESLYEFFFPPRQPRVLFTRDNKPVSTEEAQITLADIPFVRLRDALPHPIIANHVQFSQAVAAAQHSLTAPIELCIHPTEKQLNAGGQQVTLPPAELAFYLWLARRRQQEKPGVPIPVEIEKNLAYAEGFLTEYFRIKGEVDNNSPTALALEKGMEKAYFELRKTRVNKVLLSTLGAYAARPYLIQGVGPRPQKFGLTLDTDQIVIIDSERSGCE